MLPRFGLVTDQHGVAFPLVSRESCWTTFHRRRKRRYPPNPRPSSIPAGRVQGQGLHSKRPPSPAWATAVDADENLFLALLAYDNVLVVVVYVLVADRPDPSQCMGLSFLHPHPLSRPAAHSGSTTHASLLRCPCQSQPNFSQQTSRGSCPSSHVPQPMLHVRIATFSVWATWSDPPSFPTPHANYDSLCCCTIGCQPPSPTYMQDAEAFTAIP